MDRFTRWDPRHGARRASAAARRHGGAGRTPSPQTKADWHPLCPGAAGFTLIEILVVVAIIALIIMILIPSLARAREQARTVKCLTNMENMPKAALVFSAEHRGYTQTIGERIEWETIDPSGSRYEYQEGAFGNPGRWLKPWPIAYARQLGIPTLKRMENFGRHEIFMCPSDDILVHNAWSPYSTLFPGVYGILSYSANEDVFGVTGASPGSGAMTGEGQPWKDGKSGDENPVRAKRLEGKMDRIIRPSEVALFCDGGNEDYPESAALLITNNIAMHGPYLENYEYFWGRLPHYRHSDKGGVAVALADGSGRIVRPLDWKSDAHSGKMTRYVKRYTPRVRVSPYNVGTLPATQP